ncbi:bestrophin family ion channel [Flavihumibacter sp. CACIAM 22H1]|uniref:bestrophin family protein n=1 Tax=Flavihumibacter sp. CACIAM 22H1 TaxID=1812911 RepID=UPI0007A8B1BD|nr:bestrophin family ion channel [Flavihumibacter sp. CACIAM 22H1]KYP16280.1 MAG: multidrug transporter [Flavihumibacter sp. CACIAM 22H1]
MHTGTRYTPLEFFKWTRRDTYWMILLAAAPTVAFAFGARFIALPWQPIAILGTAVAFIVGFKNNASYNRIWEARQIYGAIINDSRSFAYTLRDALGGKDAPFVKQIFYRHFAWLTALRYQLREPRPWENMQRQNNQEFLGEHYQIPEKQQSLETSLQPYLSQEEWIYITGKKNKATQLSALQSAELSKLRASNTLNDFQWTQLQQRLIQLTEHQGRAERIKNFPYPRNFSSIATYLLLIFVVLVPFGAIRDFENLGKGTFLEGYTLWLNIPFSVIVTWAFHTLDTVGESSVNPFEGSANDVPITQISRLIEIDLRDMLDETNLPAPLTAQNNILL